MIHKNLRLFLNILTVNDKHYLLNRENLTQAIQMPLSQKQKTFSKFFFVFLKSILNFKILTKKDDRRSRCTSANTGLEKSAWLNV